MPAAVRSHAKAFSTATLVCAICQGPARSPREAIPAGAFEIVSQLQHKTPIYSVRSARTPSRGCTASLFSSARADSLRDQGRGGGPLKRSSMPFASSNWRADP